jgi:hypothetical protein
VTFAKKMSSWKGARSRRPLIATAVWIVLVVAIVIAAVRLMGDELRTVQYEIDAPWPIGFFQPFEATVRFSPGDRVA